MKIKFMGAAGTVTGSKFLLMADDRRVLVDCGLFQGYKQLRKRNWQPFSVDPRSIDTVVLTHAHIDHTGYLPALVRGGFSGKVLTTDSTRDLAGVLLRDSARIQEEEARYANKRKYSKHKPAMPLYTEEDAEKALSLFQDVDFDTYEDIGGGLRLRFQPAGHILGSAFVELDDGKTKVLFSGDIGRPGMPIMEAPTSIPQADYVLVECTYGDRQHGEEDPEEEIAKIVGPTLERGGTVVIPSFAVARAQTLCVYLHRLRKAGRIPDVPVYLNSPMAMNVTKLYVKHHEDHRLNDEQCREIFSSIKYIRSVEESKELNRNSSPKVVISSSGMATAGRVLHHIKAWGSDPKNTIMFAGYQAGGTRGRDMVNGAESVRIHGEDIPIRASIGVIHSLSAHGDYEDVLGWLGGFQSPPRKTFMVHGEPDSLDMMRKRIEHGLGWECYVPEHQETVELD